MSLRTRVVLLACAALGNVSYGAAPAENPTIQVLLQGENAALLTAALIENDGRVTHTLPLVSGIGGTLPAAQLDALHDAPGVARVIEDFNPQEPKEERDCPIDGGLQLHWSGSQVHWPLFNFADEPVQLVSVILQTPQDLPDISHVSFEKQSIQPMTGNSREQRFNARPLQLPPGRGVLTIDFTHPPSKIPQQSELSITVHTETCEAKLLPAYDHEEGHYHYAAVSGAAALQERGFTGRGINIAIIDSGLWEGSTALTQDTSGKFRIAARFNAITNTSDEPLIDESGHGSHMASVIAHSGAMKHPLNNRFKGIAPDAGLIPIKVFDATGNGDFLDILRGIQWVVAHRERHDIRVLNLSLAAAPRFPYWDDPINQALLKAWEAGITVVVAAGNEGPAWESIGSPGNNPYVITVGAVTDSWTPEDFSDDYIPDFSSRGPTRSGHRKPDLLAPGGHIPGVVPPNSTMARENPHWFIDTGDFVSTGSSQAAAVVSGVAALLLEIEPALTNDEIKCLLTTSAKPAINRDGRLSYSRFAQGAGYLDAIRAITLGARDCGVNDGNIHSAASGLEQLIGPAEASENGYPLLTGDVEAAFDVTPAKGASDERRWGVKAHMERLPLDTLDDAAAAAATRYWLSLYERERNLMRALLETSQSNTQNTQ